MKHILLPIDTLTTHPNPILRPDMRTRIPRLDTYASVRIIELTMAVCEFLPGLGVTVF